MQMCAWKSLKVIGAKAQSICPLTKTRILIFTKLRMMECVFKPSINCGNPLPNVGEGFSCWRLGVGRAEPFYAWLGKLHKILCESLVILPIAFFPKV